jgi:hypothetical protein
MKSITRILSAAFLGVLMLATATTLAAKADSEQRTNQFTGAKANTGMAVLFHEGGKTMLKVTDDFKVPDTPAPTWRVVDSKGNIYTLDAFKVKDSGLLGTVAEKRQIALPSYIHDVAKVQVYCAWAQVLLGEASFAAPAK